MPPFLPLVSCITLTNEVEPVSGCEHQEPAAADKTAVIITELQELVTKAGYDIEQEKATLKAQADAENQKAMADAGCTVQ